MDFAGQKTGVENNIFGLKQGQELENRAVHPHQEFPWVLHQEQVTGWYTTLMSLSFETQFNMITQCYIVSNLSTLTAGRLIHWRIGLINLSGTWSEQVAIENGEEKPRWSDWHFIDFGLIPRFKDTYMYPFCVFYKNRQGFFKKMMNSNEIIFGINANLKAVLKGSWRFFHKGCNVNLS